MSQPPKATAANHPDGRPDEIWFTRCPVPTATGLAYKLGWLTEDFAADHIKLSTLQDRREFGRHHYDHQLPTLIREGGNMLAIAARAQGAPSRLVGLTWIEEHQAILVRADSGITQASQLKGLRLALPAFAKHALPDHLRGSSIGRGMSLHGYHGALAHAGLSFDDVELVEVETGRAAGLGSLWPSEQLADGTVDAIYVKGASAVDDARKHGLVVGVDLDRLPARRHRVNNGTPRPITVHEDLIEKHFDLLVRFLYQTLRAADWARNNLAGVQAILQAETRGSADAVTEAYRDGFHEQLHPDLSDERVQLFERQKKLLLLHGFLDRDFALESWIDRRPLEAAYALLERDRLQDAAE
jgi:ABC-type nitrate/sulfonate/bicarbonate transport system substrate-binding protein